MTFRSAGLLWLLAVVPFALAFLVLRERQRSRVARRFVSERLRGSAAAARTLRPWLLAAAFVLAALAVAGPYSGYTITPVTAREANRVIVLDVSNSMAAEDVGTSRLAAAKAIALRLASAQQGRVGLVVFEGQPEVISPLTTDTDAVAALLDTVIPGEVGEPGTDIGAAIEAALRLIESDPSQKADIVVIGDGEDQGTRVREAVQKAKARGVEVSAIVVGSSQGTTIPTASGPLHDDSGQVVTTYARSDAMSELARGTGGILLENPFGSAALDGLIGRARAASAHETTVRVPIDRYQWPLAFAFVAFLLGSLLNRGAE